MSTYVIGDIQGCFHTLQALLKQIRFDPPRDQLWLTGDLVNRGVHSLEVLQWAYENQDHLVAVLGNHDFHFLAVAHGVRAQSNEDTLDPILNSPQYPQLLQWLCSCPLVYRQTPYFLVHAGIHPFWTLDQAEKYAQEVQQELVKPDVRGFLKNIFRKRSLEWSDDLNNQDRFKFIVDVMARMRVCDLTGRLEFKYKGPPDKAPQGLIPWFDFPQRKKWKGKIIFGHWGSLGFYDQKNVLCVDTGCVWGDRLTAYCLEDRKVFQEVVHPSDMMTET